MTGLLQTLRDADLRLDDSGAGRIELLVDTQGRSVSVNEAGRQMDCLNPLVDTNYGRAPERPDAFDGGPGGGISAGGPGTGAPGNACQMRGVATGIHAVLAGTLPGFSCEYVHRSQFEECCYRVTVTPLNEAYPTGAFVTYQKIAENRIVHLARIRAMLSGINALIVHEHDRRALMRRVCRIAVEAGGLRLCMTALLGRASGKVVPVGLASRDRRLLEEAKNALTSGAAATSAMIQQAIRERRAVVANESQSDTRVMREIHAKFDIGSMAVLPLVSAKRVIGVMVLYADERRFFFEDEVKLLTELTNDVALAIDHIEKRKRLEYLASYDSLTGLANRTLFISRVETLLGGAAARGASHALLLFDLHGFRNVNDGLGRTVGDALLKQFAEWLGGHVGPADVLARVGVDQFATLLPDVARTDLLPFLERIISALSSHPFVLDGGEFWTAARVGVAMFPDAGSDADTLLKHAETALKKAKSSGDRYLFHTRKMTESAAVKFTLESRLHQALDKDQFLLFYQPKLHLATGRLMGVEALIRWNDPQSGLVLPERFIGILEENGMIREVGRWVLRRAVADHLRWRKCGLNAVRVAVNVSPLQLRNGAFVREIEQAIGVDPHAAAGLELEMTESLVMEDIKHNIESLKSIRSLGVTLAIDDFGTGFSSLSYLAKLPVHTLKIDRSFITDLTTGPEAMALVSAIIKLGHSMNLNVVAEGVETEHQSRLLRLLKCDEAQGYLTSMPMSSKVFEARYLLAPQSA